MFEGGQLEWCYMAGATMWIDAANGHQLPLIMGWRNERLESRSRGMVIPRRRFLPHDDKSTSCLVKARSLKHRSCMHKPFGSWFTYSISAEVSGCTACGKLGMISTLSISPPGAYAANKCLPKNAISCKVWLWCPLLFLLTRNGPKPELYVFMDVVVMNLIFPPRMPNVA